MPEPVIRPVREEDAAAIVAVFNHFIRSSFAAYADEEMDLRIFNRFREVTKEHVFLAVESEGEVVGFAMLRPHHTYTSFKHTAELTYFLLPEFTGRGLGSKLLAMLEEAARERGITNLLAHVSSRNETSLAFHRKHGFIECGRLEEIGIKFGAYFDVVWFQKKL